MAESSWGVALLALLGFLFSFSASLLDFGTALIGAFPRLGESSVEEGSADHSRNMDNVVVSHRGIMDSYNESDVTLDDEFIHGPVLNGNYIGVCERMFYVLLQPEDRAVLLDESSGQEVLLRVGAPPRMISGGCSVSLVSLERPLFRAKYEALFMSKED